MDGQLYFFNCDGLRRPFEAAAKVDFDVNFLGQAHWYLQARITQHTDFSITLDQSQYAALICSPRFISTLPISNIMPADQEQEGYHQVLPFGFVVTKVDLANHIQIPSQTTRGRIWVQVRLRHRHVNLFHERFSVLALCNQKIGELHDTPWARPLRCC